MLIRPSPQLLTPTQERWQKYIWLLTIWLMWQSWASDSRRDVLHLAPTSYVLSMTMFQNNPQNEEMWFWTCHTYSTISLCLWRLCVVFVFVFVFTRPRKCVSGHFTPIRRLVTVVITLVPPAMGWSLPLAWWNGLADADDFSQIWLSWPRIGHPSSILIKGVGHHH